MNNLLEEIKSIFCAVGNKTMDISTATERLKRLKQENNIVTGKGKYSTTFCDAFREAVKEIPFDDLFCNTPFESLSNLAKGYELLRDSFDDGISFRQIKEKKKRELQFKRPLPRI